jgi:hypothetical protein
MTLTNLNALSLEFTNSLLTDLTINDFTITACTSPTYTLEKWTNLRYYIPLIFSDIIPANCSLSLKFVNPHSILSTENGFLLNTSLYATLYETQTTAVLNAAITAEATKTSGTITTSTTAATISISLMNPNPACL